MNGADYSKNRGPTLVIMKEAGDRPSIASDETVTKIEETARANRRLTLDEHFLDVSRSFPSEIVAGGLGYRELCARWVPKILTTEHKQNRVLAVREFLKRYQNVGEEFLYSIVTGMDYSLTPPGPKDSA